MSTKKQYIIIKFSPNDNIPGSHNEMGWVDYFASILTKSLKYQVDHEIEIIKKTELELITPDDFKQVDLIFYILSPAMVFASNINQDANELEQAFNFDIPFINKKVKKVFKAPVKIEELPLSLSTPTYYRFYDHLDENQEEYETYEGWSKYQDNRDFWRVFADVLTDTIKILNKSESEPEKIVFISDKSQDYFESRNIIKRELKAFNYEIFPDEDFSIEANYMEDPELFFLKKSDLSLHFPDEFLDLDNEERKNTFSKIKSIKRFIWFNPVESIKPDKKTRYNELKVQLKPYSNIEAVESTIEELKDILKENLIQSANQNVGQEASQRQTIYIVSDSTLNNKITSSLKNSSEISDKFEIELISNVENVTDYRHLHYELLKRADYFFIVYLKKNDAWLKAIVSEIKKAPGFRTDKKIIGKYILTKNETLINPKIVEGFNILAIDNQEDLLEKISLLH